METANKINNEQLQELELSAIVPSNYNPRKTFTDEDIAELAESIRVSGVIQPIRVRPVEDGKFEIICGERRYRASQKAGKNTIPAIVCRYADKEARETAVIENLQRKDVLPLEEAEGYNELMKTGDYTVQSLAQVCGQSEKYIRVRLKLTELIEPIKRLLAENRVALPVAVELCKYTIEIQEQVYQDHLKPDIQNWWNWKELKPAELSKRINEEYTNQLNHFKFDKTACTACFKNSQNQTLFNDNCGRCMDQKCLASKNTLYIVEKTMRKVQEHPEALLCVSCQFDQTAVEKLNDKGYEVKHLDNLYRFPVLPVEPHLKDYKGKKEYKAALQTYRQAKLNYANQTEEVRQFTESNRLITCLCITLNDIELLYTVTNSSSKNKVKTPAELLDFLQAKSKRNDEIRQEKTIADVKKLVPDMEYKGTFSGDEEMMLYFIMLGYLKRSHWKELGFKEEEIYYSLTDEQRFKIASNLTEDLKILILRDYISASMERAYRGNIYTDFLLKFTKQHIPEQVKEVEKAYQDIFDQQQERIDERTAVARVQLKKQKDKEKASKKQMQIVA